MTTVSESDDAPEDLYIDTVEALSRATVRRSFDPYVDIDWDAPDNVLDDNDPRWQLLTDTNPLASTDWYAEQPVQKRVDIGRWITANTFKVGIQFEMILIRGVVHYAGKLSNSDPVFRYLMHEVTDECNHIQMFQEFINRNGQDVPGMRRMSRILGPVVGFLSGYLGVLLFIGVLAGEQPVHYQQTLLLRGTQRLPPLLNRIIYIHLAEEARHITFADDHLAERIQYSGRCKRAAYAIMFPLFLRWLMGEILTPPRSFARQFQVPRQTFKAAFWRSDQSRQMLAESAADARRVADSLGLRTIWSRWIWRVLGIDGRLPRFRGEPNRLLEGSTTAQLVEMWTTMWARVTAAAIMAAVALLATPDGLRIIAVATAGACVWAMYHALQERRGGVMGNQPFEWPRLFVWVAVCVIMIPAGGLIGLALVVFTILAVAEFMPTL
ncbi:diiron oxygenase [Mycolicibacterium septicum DSM 44393]|uniref:Diiron oxygenase n=1 Tax=Mycolicibacterium septicum DSM 44393 TaxID=1341646 RepID=A0A7X6MX19_9MYCO|nr:diiron oxygenase [Mycolicibacterium septicum]NKZ15466.1 diiron oxygenase [Mycolicibacterium septicum DSM 44393]